MREKISADRLIANACNLKFIIPLLSEPDRIDWPASWPEMDALRRDVKNDMEESIRPLVDISMAAHLLLIAPERRELRRNFLDTLDPDILPADIWSDDGVWRLTPVVTVVPEQTSDCIFRFMVGALPAALAMPWPMWLSDCLDASGKAAIMDAFRTACTLSGISRNLFVFPLMSPCTKIHGRSLGLPIALGAMSALTGESLASRLIATGDVRSDTDGFPVEAVSHIPEKARCVSGYKFQVMLVPHESPMISDAPMTIRAVRNLREAWLWARLYAPGRENDLKLLQQMQNNAGFLVNNCLDIAEPDLLEWLLQSENGKCLQDAIVSDSKLVGLLVGKLRECLKPANRNLEHAKAIGRILPDDETSCATLEEHSPMEAFQWATLNLEIANHCGDTTQSGIWCQKAQKLRDRVRHGNPEAYSNFINSSLVSRHNTYSFSPNPPPEFEDALEEETRYNRGISDVLGSLYGTLAQNYAFCGPKYLSDVERYIKLAQEQFDNVTNPALLNDRIREFSYLVYAFLDAGDHARAREALHQYLQIQSLADIKPWSGLNPYEQATVVRYLADTAEDTSCPEAKRLGSRYIEELSGVPFKNELPYPLIACNLGRLALSANDSDLAVVYFKKSVALCENAEEAVCVMALLPLSGLYGVRSWQPEPEERAAKILETIRTSRFLDQKHFEALTGGGTEYALNLVRENPARFFPFSYR